MTERPTATAKLLPILAPEGRLAEALAPIWPGLIAPTAAKLGLDSRAQAAIREGCLQALAGFSGEPEGQPRRQALTRWLVRLRLDLSMEELLLVLIQLDRALKQAGWQLGLPAPDWLALTELLASFFEAILEEASAGWQGLASQNHQLRDELAYFRRLAASLETGQDLGDHLNLAVRETARLLHCEFCAILLPTPEERDVLQIKAAVAPRILANALEGMRFPLAENGLIAQVFLTGAPASTYQPLDDLEITMRRRQTLESLGFSQLMAYPLQTHGRVLGVLCVANRLDDQPWQALEEEWLAAVASQLAASIRLSQVFGKQEASELELAGALATAMRLVDPAIAARGEATGALARRMGEALGLSESQRETLEMAGLLHDLGMLALPEAVRHRPGPLWPPEWARVRRHPEAACEALAPLTPLEPLLPAIRHHHERWDGGGYPGGLRGQAIPLEARVLAVADAYCAMTHARPHRAAMAHEEAIAELEAHADSQFDRVAVQALVEAFRREPAAGLLPLPVAPAEAPAPSGPKADPVGLLAQGPKLIGLLAELVATRDPETFHDRFFSALAANASVEAAAIWRYQGGKLSLEATSDQAISASPAELALESYVAACRVPVAEPDWADAPRFARPQAVAAAGYGAALALPLVAADEPVGVLTIYRRQAGAFKPEEQPVLELAAAMLAHGLSTLALQARHREVVALDPLTGLASHRAFMERVASELKRAERFALPLSAVLIDLDGFTRHNETHGYGLGDEALKQVAELIESSRRPADLSARLENDCLAVLMPECGAPEAMAFAEELRLAVAASVFPGRRAGGARLTASVGVTTRTAGGIAPGDFLADMRQALANARKEGVNRLLFHAGAHEHVN
ncbi:MAG: HD domain-containing phosphohydrolase [Candidatus Sericytochromatia bacterium]